jgi:hypothetical protein
MSDMAKATTLEKRWEYIRRLLEEAGDCECENCVKQQEIAAEGRELNA